MTQTDPELSRNSDFKMPPRRLEAERFLPRAARLQRAEAKERGAIDFAGRARLADEVRHELRCQLAQAVAGRGPVARQGVSVRYRRAAADALAHLSTATASCSVALLEWNPVLITAVKPCGKGQGRTCRTAEAASPCAAPCRCSRPRYRSTGRTCRAPSIPGTRGRRCQRPPDEWPHVT